MSDSVTGNFGWTKPAVGASAETWGTKWNQNLDEIDSQVVQYLPLAGGTVTGDLWAQDFYTNGNIVANGAVSATAGFSTPGNITAGGAVVIDSTLGVNYAGIGANWFAFGWNGSINCYVDGSYEGDIATVGWVESWVGANYKPIGAYTPNQNVDVNASVQWWNDTVSGTLVANNAAALHQFSNVSVGGTLGVSGLLSAYGNLNAAGNVTAGGTVTAGGNGVICSAYQGNAFAFSFNGAELIQYMDGVQEHHLIRSFSGSYTALYQMMVNGGAGTLNGWAVGGGVFTVPVSWTSDRALKSNIREVTTDALAAINAIPVYAADVRSVFNGAPVQHWDCTIMADDVGRHIPAALIPADDADVKYASLREGPIIAMMLRALQQLSAEVTQLKGS